ncbi:MAG: phosphoadenosine phosphosulfate reductase family protein [Deltaproteobacteria bacterium]|jgi:3'-phosphoadenosine 5'-phosphosulfate sulfotransferase (PAPS reductase)/FAD synthetase|nr:phosphoadenosine phosphosulfate reductase family protein [Deltaproteobacteria bacterium]
MYSFIWDKKTCGYKLTNQTGRYVANEIRPVFAQELTVTKLGLRFEYNKCETRPLLWAQKNTYIVNDEDEKGNPIGRKVAQLNCTQYGKPLSPEFFFTGQLRLEPVDIEGMLAANASMMDIIVADAKRRAKELYDEDIKRCDIAYIAFSGGKDSVVLLDICHKVLPLSVPVIFSDTDMELPDTYKVWEEIQDCYPDREFIAAKAESSALENWRRFAPPSRTIRWCCSVHKSTPAIMLLKDKLHKSAIKAMAFVGVRGDESISRSFYDDATDGAKNASQLNLMPILDWGAHELWLYIFANDLLINCAYKKGLTRVGCMMCPESSEKYVWFVDKAYPRELKPYNDIIIETSSKGFETPTERTEFIGSLNWQARKNGLILKDALTNPLEEHNGLTVIFQSPHFTSEMFYEWIKTLGTVVRVRETEQQRLKLPNTLDDGIPFSYYAPYTGGGKATFEFRSDEEKLAQIQPVRAFFRKVTGCIACRNCEAECSGGAITIENGKLKINGAKCTHCRKCYDIDNYCLRFKSMYKPDTESNNLIRGIANYQNFGLRENDRYQWVSALVDLGEEFFPWHYNHPLGKNMVPSARIWFIQSGLIYESNKKPTPLVEVFRKLGGECSIGWDFIWIALVNNAILLKWFVTATDFNKPYTSDELADFLKLSNPNLGKSTIDGGLAALRDMLTKSPLGGDGAVTSIEMKGKQVKSITRKAKEVNPLTILYGLYLIAAKTERGGFTVRELMKVDEESAYISPIVVFGISPDRFKKQCEGLKTKYGDYIETTFTHGNDEVTIFPKKHTAEDIIRLALGE